MCLCINVKCPKRKKKKSRGKLIFILLTSQAGAPACGACTWGASKFSWKKFQLNQSLPFTRFNSIRRTVCQLSTPVSSHIYPLEPPVACIGQLSLSVNGSVRSASHALIPRAPVFRLIKAEGCDWLSILPRLAVWAFEGSGIPTDGRRLPDSPFSVH